jgi:hypothetical protein
MDILTAIRNIPRIMSPTPTAKTYNELYITKNTPPTTENKNPTGISMAIAL